MYTLQFALDSVAHFTYEVDMYLCPTHHVVEGRKAYTLKRHCESICCLAECKWPHTGLPSPCLVLISQIRILIYLSCATGPILPPDGSGSGRGDTGAFGLRGLSSRYAAIKWPQEAPTAPPEPKDRGMAGVSHTENTRMRRRGTPSSVYEPHTQYTHIIYIGYDATSCFHECWLPAFSYP